MKNNLKEIKAGTGLGDIRFGMTRNDIKKLLGEPDEIESFSYSEDEDDLSETWHFDELELSVGFDEVDDWKLVTISVSSNFYVFNGEVLVGMKKENFRQFLKNQGITDSKSEKFSTEESSSNEVISTDKLGLSFWFENNVLTEVQCTPLLADEYNYKWPE